MALSYENLSRLITSPDLLSHLQNLKLDGREQIVSFQWHGPHFLAFLRYATKLCLSSNYENDRFNFLHYATKLCLCFNYKHDRFNDLLKHLDDSASDCILYGEIEHYKFFLEILLSFMPEIREFFTLQKLLQLSDGTPNTNEVLASFIGFLLETIGELLNCGTDSGVLVSYQVKFLLKELESLLVFLGDTKPEPNNNILPEIEAVANEAGFFLHSFFFTADLVTVTKMDLALYTLVKRILQVRIKSYCAAASEELNCGIGSLLVAESPREVSAESGKVAESQQNISMVDEIIVGCEDSTTQILRKLLGGTNFRQIISIVGMPGLGKTTLAKKLYNASHVRYYFDTLSWCVVSQTYRKRKMLIDILSSISKFNRDKILEMDDEEMAEHLYKNLKGRRYLIVMDDIWDTHSWHEIGRYFPDDKNGSRILFTSRLKNVASEISHVIIEPPPLSEGESWDLLEQKVFKKERCPQELQDIGKQIAANCKGLPLLVVVIASVLSNMEKSKNSWLQVATSISFYVSQNSDDFLSILKLSYKNLPIHLKPCFLYLSAFEEDAEIPVRKLLLLWIAEGFIERNEWESFEDAAEEYLMELINRSLLQVSKRRTDNGVKACILHDLVLEMCWKVATEENFLFQHQFLVSKNRSRLEKSHLSETLSILHNSKKIRILESTNDLSFTETLTELRYLEMPSKLTSSIGRLQNLEFLLAERTTNILPRYLLDLPKLRHLRVGGPARFSKNCESSQINSLQTLSFVCIFDSKDEEILKCSPNLRTLSCAVLPDHCPDLNIFSRLESLKIVFYGSFKGDHTVFKFPWNIKKLTLSKMGLTWKNMSLIGTLPNLEILKLEDEACEGKIWETNDDEFKKLKFLKLDDLDLVHWDSSHDHFPILERLVLRYCDKLESIPLEFSCISTLQKIEVHACGKDVEDSAKQIGAEQIDNGNDEFEVLISKAILD